MNSLNKQMNIVQYDYTDVWNSENFVIVVWINASTLDHIVVTYDV